MFRKSISRCRTSLLPAITILVFASAHGAQSTRAADRQPVVSVYLPQQATDARQRAQEQCKPLVVHIVPNPQVGVQQVSDFHGRFGKISKDVLDKVVIVILPRDRYAKFAAQLGITDAGGLRTISAYDLDTLDAPHTPTGADGTTNGIAIGGLPERE